MPDPVAVDDISQETGRGPGFGDGINPLDLSLSLVLSQSTGRMVLGCYGGGGGADFARGI